MNRTLSFCFLILCFCIPAGAQTTEFTYQGRLVDGSLAASGTYEMRFQLFDAETGGTQQPQSTPITLEFTVAGNNPVTVSSGVFTVRLDFTNAAFTGAARFLEISVRRTESDPFVVLNPRQPITSAPHNIRSLSSGSSDSLSVACVLCVTDGQIQSIDGSKVNGEVASSANSSSLGGLPASRFVQSDTNGNVGMGTTPGTGSKLTVGGQIETTSGGIKFPDGTTQSAAGLTSISTSNRLIGGGTAQSPLDIASPLDVRAADNPARQPFSASVNNTGVVFTNVSGSGVTLVIENLSGFVAASEQSGGLIVTLGIGNDSFIRTYNIGPSLIYQIPNSNAVAYYNHQVRLYVSQGQRLEVTFPANLNRAMQFSGYYVLVP